MTAVSYSNINGLSTVHVYNLEIPSSSNCPTCVSVNATNPLVRHEGPNAVQAVVQAVLQDTAAPTTAVRILAHKIHSPQEREAMKALSVSVPVVVSYFSI